MVEADQDIERGKVAANVPDAGSVMHFEEPQFGIPPQTGQSRRIHRR
jgi:hypothetical protein